MQILLQRQHYLLSYLKTLSVGPAGVWTRDLPHGSPVLYQLSQPVLLLLLFFDPDVFYNPGNENELLDSMDIDHPVRIQGKKNSINNSVIESEVSEEDSD